MDDNLLGYTPTGKILPNKITVYSMYVLSVVLIGMGVYFCIDMKSWEILAVLAGGAVLTALMGFASGKIAWYWNDEQFTVMQPLMKPVTYSFTDIDGVGMNYQAITIVMKNKKRYVITRTSPGSQEFLNQIRMVLG